MDNKKKLLVKLIIEMVIISISLISSDLILNNFSSNLISKISASFVYFIAVSILLYLLFDDSKTNYILSLKHYFNYKYWPIITIYGFVVPIIIIVLYLLNPIYFSKFSSTNYYFIFSIVLLNGANTRYEEKLKKTTK